MSIPEWAKPLVAARERGATLQIYNGDEWIPLCTHPNWSEAPGSYRIKPGTDHAPSAADPLIFGSSIPGNEPVPVRDEYVPLTTVEVVRFKLLPSEGSSIRSAHRAGWERRRTP